MFVFGEVMETREITIRVDAEAARAYAASSPEERRKIDLLLGLRLGEVTSPTVPLGEIMRDISEKAQARGLTEDELEGGRRWKPVT